MEFFIETYGARQSGDLHRAREDLRASGAEILGDSANYADEILYFRIKLADRSAAGAFLEAFKQTTTGQRYAIRPARSGATYG